MSFPNIKPKIYISKYKQIVISNGNYDEINCNQPLQVYYLIVYWLLKIESSPKMSLLFDVSDAHVAGIPELE